MAPLIILAISNLTTALLTAWLLHRKERGLSPMPALPAKAEVHDEDGNHEPVYQKGRPVL